MKETASALPDARRAMRTVSRPPSACSSMGVMVCTPRICSRVTPSRSRADLRLPLLPFLASNPFFLARTNPEVFGEGLGNVSGDRIWGLELADGRVFRFALRELIAEPFSVDCSKVAQRLCNLLCRISQAGQGFERQR